MKISAALILASLASTVSASMTISGKTAAKVLRAARKLEQNAAGDDAAAQEEEFSYLKMYNLKMIGCREGQQYVDPENGEYEYSSVIFRLCPSEGGCDSDSVTGCSGGSGDYMVGINTFVQSYFEDQRDNMQWDDNFQVDRYAECAEYEMEQGDDNANQVQYFIGPTCSEDGTDIKLAVFDDYTCTTASESSFEEISNGWSLPYEEGGIVSTACIDCVDYDEVDGNGDYGLRDMCMQLYEKTSYACESSMEYYSYYGQNVQGCEVIQELLPKSGGASGGKIFGWFVFIVLVGGIAAYIVWWRKKKSADGIVA